MMMKRRKAETLIEFLMASLIFVEIMAGVFSFIANQTETIVGIRNRDTMMFHFQRFMNFRKGHEEEYTVEKYNSDDVCMREHVKLESKDNIVTVSKSKSTMKFNLRP